MVRSLTPLLDDRALVEFVLLDGVLHAVTLIGGRARLTTLGPVEAVRDLVERVPSRAAQAGPVGRHARRFVGGGPDAAPRRRPARRAAAPAAGAGRPAAGRGADRAVAGAPLAGAAVVRGASGGGVALGGACGARPPRPAGVTGPIVAASGPRLPGAAARRSPRWRPSTASPRSRAARRRRWPRSTARGWPIWPPTAGVNAANPLFSALHLADGPLTVYDLERLRTPPKLVVLAACEGGRSVVRAATSSSG